MVTLKEYEIYLKVKKFIETEGCDESSIILLLTNGVGIIPAYVPLIIESEDMKPTKYYSLSAAASGCGVSIQMISYACRNWKMRIVRRKGALLFTGFLDDKSRLCNLSKNDKSRLCDISKN